MIDCAFYGFCAADAEPRTSQAGKQWVRLRVGVGKDDAVQWVSVAVFGKAAAFREQHNELRAIHEAALGKLRGISYDLYIILGINLVILARLAWLAWLALRDVPFW